MNFGETKSNIITEIMDILQNCNDLEKLQNTLEEINSEYNKTKIDDNYCFEYCIDYIKELNETILDDNHHLRITAALELLIDKINSNLIINNTEWKENDRDNYILSNIIFGSLKIEIYFAYRYNYNKTYGDTDYIKINGISFHPEKYHDTEKSLESDNINMIIDKFIKPDVYNTLKNMIVLTEEELLTLDSLDYTKYFIAMIFLSALNLEKILY